MSKKKNELDTRNYGDDVLDYIDLFDKHGNLVHAAKPPVPPVPKKSVAGDGRRRRSSPKRFPVKLVGNTSWIGGPDQDIILRVPIKRAILRSDSEIVVDCNCDTNQYAVSLKSKDGLHFDGEFTGRNGTNAWTVQVRATLYSNSSGYLLFGSWVEEDGDYVWCAEIWPTERFPDEKR